MQTQEAIRLEQIATLIHDFANETEDEGTTQDDALKLLYEIEAIATEETKQ